MKKFIKMTVLASFILYCLLPLVGYGQDSTKIANLLSETYLGVPSSPAFELLPNKPSEVAHLTSGHDIAANISNFVDGGKLKSGAAFDIRPLAYTVGSLTEYQKHRLTQFLWRSVFSLGTASDNSKNGDVYIGAGIRIPLIDHSDPRADSKYIAGLENAYKNAYNKLTPPANPNDVTAADFQKEADNFAKSNPEIQKLRDKFAADHWNAFRWDVGIGASDRAASGFLKADSIFRDRIGLWTAVGLPLGSKCQITVSGNTAWINAKADTSENNRSVIGARALYFLTDWLSASGEYAKIYSAYAQSKLNENWNHLAVVVEFKIPKLGGWFGLAYGGDSAHRTDSGTKFSFNYAIYTDRMIKKGN